MINHGNVSAGDGSDGTGNGVTDINGCRYDGYCCNRNDTSIYFALGALLVS
jgi:hypothetical protein